MIGPAHREARDLLRARLQWVTQQVRCRNAIAGLLAQHNVASAAALPALTQVRVHMLEAQLALLREQAKTVQRVLQPQLIPTADVQRLVWIPGIGTVVAFTLVLEIDDIRRFPTAKAFVSYCRLVPGAGNSGGKVRQKRTKDGNRYLKLAFSHAAVRAIQYSPEIRRFYQALARRKPKAVARAIVAKELARIVYIVLSRQVDFNHTFKGKPLSTRKASQWPRLSSPSV
jgi:transposase